MDIDLLGRSLKVVLEGGKITIALTAVTIVIGITLGIIFALMKLSKIKVLNLIASFYTWIFRGTPMLLQFFFFYFALPLMWKIELSPFVASMIVLGLNSGAYMTEIVRSGIQSIDKGQFEAAKALGFTYGDTMKKIILPQTFKVIIPPLGNEFITILKDTSLASTITLTEVLNNAKKVANSTFSPAEPYLTAAVFYLFLTTIFTYVFKKIEKKLSVY
ncbi:amino acid ABC transporter permease [Clostridium cellulovorans]|uniref:Polar amino acid ABC transporter, inner membrane subunit n=1 Tax=Clostridium cellulovorans (strain ATCC 35296 / DSM 3052 / OCM 3 / 743B) TaxID=573061 RepID=D9SWX6_CLOC7|nr:amino acid ABC transporter permease [Clostridium cellulovorans]ADL51337.1 polar amino acid ABC transporter, inner membrane subunit [Clostridium cellulovorans 743B]